MKKYLKKHLFQLIYLIPVSFIAIGSFVLNIYLNQFGIIDVALFDSRTIFVGFVALFQFISFFFCWSIYILKYRPPLGSFFLIINCFFKPAFFSSIIYVFLANSNGHFSKLEELFFWLLFSGNLLYLCILQTSMKFKNIQKLKIQNKISFLLRILLGLGLCILYVILILKNTVLFNISISYFCISLFFSISLFFKWNKNKMQYDDDMSKFDSTGAISKLDFQYAILILILVAMMFLYNYSCHVFPYISSNMGGGYYKYNTIILDDDSVITGKIIHSNSEYIYIIKEEEKLSQYPINKIKSYEITKSYEIVEDAIDKKEAEVIVNGQLPEIIENIIVDEPVIEPRIEVIENQQLYKITEDTVVQ